MKTLTLLVISFAALLSFAGAQTPAKHATPAPKLTPKDIKVFRFALEYRDQTFPMNDREMPDELLITTSSERIHISGKKKVDDPARVKGRLISTIGKLALMPSGDRSGKLVVKFPTAEDVRLYSASVQLADGTLDTKDLILIAGKTYTWSVKTEGSDTTFAVMDGATEVASTVTPKNKFKAFGFAATVHYQGNEADMVITFD